MPGWATFDALAAHAQAHPETTWLVSNEFMSAWPDAFTQEAARALSGCDVFIVAYIRRYDQWIRSAYAEETRAGMNCRDIDHYVDHMRSGISALSNLQGWASRFGWERLRVRSLHPADLVGGDLLADFGHAIGLGEFLTPTVSHNVSPGWMELELIRRLTQCNAAQEWGGADPEAVLPLAALIGAIQDIPSDTAYLSENQLDDLQQDFNRDANILRSRGQLVSPVTDAEKPRTFVPAFEQIPAKVREVFFARARTQDFTVQHPVAAQAAARLAKQMVGLS